MPIPDIIRDLVGRFDDNKGAYRSHAYNEAQLRQEFLNPFEREQLEREIAATDSQIDRLVYELYGLTEEEIKIVEGEK